MPQNLLRSTGVYPTSCKRSSILKEDDNKPDSEDLDRTASYDIPICGPGTQIGHFSIKEEIGRGGMGVVYLAQDTKLDRPVAIKSIPPILANNDKVKSRFKREAKLLASLDHPDIATIHDIIEDKGISYLVLEYIPGDTLRDRITQGPLPAKEVLSLGGQIADAFASAHEHGIVHRDLKPANIKITKDGRIKVLDFGIAKAVESGGPNAYTTVTEPGQLIGTPAYMSPEQARGKPTDERCDIWAFGCVLYEMLTGKPPFDGETASDTLAGVIGQEPNWEALPHATPVNVKVLIRRCLEKDAKRRLRHMADVALEIRETVSLPAVVPPVTITQEPIAQPLAVRTLIVGCAVCLLLGALATGIILGTYTPSALPEGSSTLTTRSSITLPENQVLGSSRSCQGSVPRPVLALSPDGSRLVYVADLGGKTQLFLRSMNEFEATAIPGTEGAFCPFFSPDGNSVGFFTIDKLMKVSLLSGAVETLCAATNPYGGCWDSDGTIYFVEEEFAKLSRVLATGNRPKQTVKPELGEGRRGLSPSYPQILPGGRGLLLSTYLSARSAIELLSLETGTTKVLLEGGYYARYVPTGHIVYAKAESLYAVPFDLEKLEVTGNPVSILKGLSLEQFLGRIAQFAFSGNGTLVYVPGGNTSLTRPVWVNRKGERIGEISIEEQVYLTSFQLSPDDTKLALTVYDVNTYILVYNIANGTQDRLTMKGNSGFPAWTPDGKQIAFWSNRNGKPGMYMKPVDGKGEVELLVSDPNLGGQSRWSPDGRHLAIPRNTGLNSSDIAIYSCDKPHETTVSLETEHPEWAPVFSPDGRWIAYLSDMAGKYEVYVEAYPDRSGRGINISNYEGGEEPVWSSDGSEIFYRNNDKWMAVSVSTAPKFSAKKPELLFEGSYFNCMAHSFDVLEDEDGQQQFLLLERVHDDSNVRELHVVNNWFEELKRLAPPSR
jgi:eukaryotic-like serine/threonine-protein kinase